MPGKFYNTVFIKVRSSCNRYQQKRVHEGFPLFILIRPGKFAFEIIAYFYLRFDGFY